MPPIPTGYHLSGIEGSLGDRRADHAEVPQAVRPKIFGSFRGLASSYTREHPIYVATIRCGHSLPMPYECDRAFHRSLLSVSSLPLVRFVPYHDFSLVST